MERIVVRIILKLVIVVGVFFLGLFINHAITGSRFWNPIVSGLMIFFMIGVIFYRPKKKKTDDDEHQLNKD
jgi:hypothetical protein